MGIKNVGAAGNYKPAGRRNSRSMHGERGLNPSRAFFRVCKRQERSGRRAKTRRAGLAYACVCVAIDHKGILTKDLPRGRRRFQQGPSSRWRRKASAFSNCHGYEFQPYKDGALLDLDLFESGDERVPSRCKMMCFLELLFPGAESAKKKLLEFFSAGGVDVM